MDLAGRLGDGEGRAEETARHARDADPAADHARQDTTQCVKTSFRRSVARADGLVRMSFS